MNKKLIIYVMISLLFASLMFYIYINSEIHCWTIYEEFCGRFVETNLLPLFILLVFGFIYFIALSLGELKYFKDIDAEEPISEEDKHV